MRRETFFTPFENSFEINKLHSPTWKMGDGEMASLREEGLIGECTIQPSLYLQKGMCLAELEDLVRGCEYLGCHCRRDKFPLAPHLGRSLPPAKIRMVRRSYLLCANGEWLCRERGDRDLSLLCFGQPATSIFCPSPAQQDREREKNSCTSWMLPQEMAWTSLWCSQVVELFF